MRDEHVDALNIVANFILLIGFVPAFFFMVDYVIVRPFRRYEPWWQSGIGIMFATLSIAIILMGGVVLASLFFGSDYPGRSLFRLFGYAAFLAATTMLLVVYIVERRSAEPVLFKRKASHVKHPRRRRANTDAH